MRIVSFSEGTHPEKGSSGIAAVPGICRTLSELGNDVTLILGNNPYPNQKSHLLTLARLNEASDSSFEILYAPGWTKWALAPRLALTPQLVKKADVIFLHSLYSFPVFVGFLLAQIYKKPYILYPHGVLAPFQRQVSFRKKAVYNWVIANRILNKASSIIYTSAGELEEALPLKITAPTEIIPHGVEQIVNLPDDDGTHFRKKYLDAHQGPVLLFLGRLNAKKGLDILIESFPETLRVFPDARLVIIGGGDPPSFEMKMRNLVTSLHLEEKVIFTGPLFGKEKESAYKGSDLFILPSIAENFCMTMFEAMTFGLPVVIAENLNLSGEVQKARAGCVVARNHVAFSDAIIALLNDPLQRNELVVNGYNFIKSYTWAQNGEKLNKVVHKVVDRNK